MTSIQTKQDLLIAHGSNSQRVFPPSSTEPLHAEPARLPPLEPIGQASADQIIQLATEVVMPEGSSLHVRPVMKLYEALNQPEFAGLSIQVTNKTNGNTANGINPMTLVCLEALAGNTLVFEVSGPAAKQGVAQECLKQASDVIAGLSPLS